MTLRSSIRRFDTHTTNWINRLFAQSGWRPLLASVTGLGDPIAVIIIAASVITLGVYQNDLALIFSGVIIPITVGIGALIKLLVERARPISEYSAKLGTFSFPSGHSSGSMIAFGVLAYLAFMELAAPWNMAAISLLLVPLMVGISRVYLGAHYPSDVLAGWLLGIMGLLVVIFGVSPL